MPECEFSEDEFECMLLYELQRVHGPAAPFFKPNRVLENVVGYDLAIDTHFRPFAGRRVSLHDPRLLALLPVQKRAVIPARYVSGLIQCKVPMNVTQRRPQNRRAWNHWRGSHFRIKIDAHQCEVLVEIERELSGAAIVRYAAPCFDTFSAADAFGAINLIAHRSHFQSPARLQNHSTYTYVAPLQRGRGFSEPEDLEASRWQKELDQALGLAPDESLLVYIARFWDRLQRVERFWDELVVTDVDRSSASIVAGAYVDLPIDPLGYVDEERLILEMGGDGRPPLETIGDFAAVILCLQRVLRRVVGCELILSIGTSH